MVAPSAECIMKLIDKLLALALLVFLVLASVVALSVRSSAVVGGGGGGVGRVSVLAAGGGTPARSARRGGVRSVGGNRAPARAGT